MAPEDIVEPGVDERPVSHDDPPGHDRVPGRKGSASQPRLDRIGEGAGERQTDQWPAHQVANGTDRETSELAVTTEAGRRSTRGDLKHVTRRHATGTLA
jgi:hypothetical protein